MTHHRFVKGCGLGAVFALLLVNMTIVWGGPKLYEQPALQSPVRGEPDDLLLLAGAGLSADDTVVYEALTDTTRPLIVPADSNALRVEVVSAANVPNALTVRLPAAMRSGKSYALWVRSARGEWSNGVRINDARPLWITPSRAFATASIAGLPRSVKIVGRNLRAAPGAVAAVRFTGPEVLTLPAQKSDDAVGQYAAVVQLPARLKAGEYSVQIARDGESWAPLNDQRLSVQPDPPMQAEVALKSCKAGDGEDDTACLVTAIREAAISNGDLAGGVVVLGEGAWDLIDSTALAEGIVLPPGVSLKGMGSSKTRIVRHAAWNCSKTQAVFTLTGANTISGITFSDTTTFKGGTPPCLMLRVGRQFYRSALKAVDDIVITGNVFDKPYIAVGDGGLPLRRLLVTHNTFGAFHTGLALSGNKANERQAFTIEDAVIAFNTFKPGSYLDTRIEQGTIASTIGASHRLDFSHNTADGAATDYLYSPADARGWRAAFFWHMTGNHELMLVSDNTATCTGDKTGDGEAIGYDGHGNTFAFDSARSVLEASDTTAVVSGPLVQGQYQQHWLQIVDGPGVGQVRKIIAYSSSGSRVRFTVSPEWDVSPEAGKSRVSVAREYWQVYTVGNVVDHRKPLCRKSNRTRSKGGVIGLWAQTADSVVEGNRQYDTDGILFQQAYSAVDRACADCRSWTALQSFVDVRGNLIEGEYNAASRESHSGIQGSHGASPSPGSSPPVASYGVSISHNTIRHADGMRGGAISVPLTWHAGPAPHRWPLVDNLLIHHNDISDLRGGTGISLQQGQTVWRTVLFANSCRDVGTPLRDGGKETVSVCPSDVGSSCECNGSSRPRKDQMQQADRSH